MEKNGAWGASPICSSCISTKGLLKRGLLLVKIVHRREGKGVGGICKNVCWMLFILLLVTMIDGI